MKNNQKFNNVAKKIHYIWKYMLVIAVLGVVLVIVLEMTGIGQNCEIKYLCKPP